MNRLVTVTLLSLTAGSASILFMPPAQAETYTVCSPVTSQNIIQNPADHQGAYADGYSEGRQSAREGEAYKPRSAGGEFARGFEDGYYGRHFTGQEYAVRDKVEYYTSQQCNTYTAPNRDVRWRRVRDGARLRR